MDQPDFKGFSGPRGRPTKAERRLIEASMAGEAAEVAEFTETERTVSAALIAAIATGRFRHRNWKGWSLHELGLMLADANISQHLDIQRRRIPAPLMFAGCTFGKGIDLDDATIEGHMVLMKCLALGGLRLGNARISGTFNASTATFENKDGDAIFAQGVRAATWFMDGATVKGRFDINAAEIAGQFSANGSTFDNEGSDAIFAQGVKPAGWFMSEATVKGRFAINAAEIAGQFSANGSTFDNEGGEAIFAQGVKAAGWFMDGTTVKGRFDLNSADIAGYFNADDATFDNEGGDAIFAQGVKAVRWHMGGATVNGRFDIYSAVIAGQFAANSTAFDNEGGDAIFAQGVRAATWFMDGATVKGRFDINGAEIAGQFLARETAFDNEGGDAIFAQGVRAADWFVDGATVKGRFNINGADIAGYFNADGATFENGDGEALGAQGAKTAGWFMHGATVKGRFDVNSADIAGQFIADGTTFENENGDAFLAAFVRFRGGIFISGLNEQGNEIREPSVKGGIDLSSAEISKILRIHDTMITASRHRAISMREATVTGETSFRGSTIIGHIHANRARFNGRLSFKGITSIIAATTARARAQLPAKIGDAYNAVDEERQHRFRHHAIALHEARIEGRLVMPDILPEGIVDLTRARCDTLEDSSEGWPPPLPRGDTGCGDRCLPIDTKGTLADIRHLVLDGFEYQHIEFPSGGRDGREAIAPARVRWLTGQPAEDLVSHFNPQPWRQAASALRTMGYDEAARSVSIEQRVRQRLAADTPRFQRAVSWTLHKVADYGFNPWKTVGIALALALICAVVFRLGLSACGGHGGLSASGCQGGPAYVQVVYGDLEGANRNSGPYPAFNALIYSLDRLLPIPDLGMESYWRPNTEATVKMRHPLLRVAGHVVVGDVFPIGSMLYLISMLEAFLGAILVAIAITGFTGLLTRDEK